MGLAPRVIDLSLLTPSTGFLLQGETGDLVGWSVSTAGDVNGDGIDDLIIGAPYGDSGGYNAGEAYVIFGQAGTTRTNIDLTTLSAADGFIIQGDVDGDYAGLSVSSAGDVNGDGIDDMIVAARRPGEAYVIFGRTGAARGNIDLTTLPATDGFVIQGAFAGYGAGRTVSSAGDVNGDGINDMIIGAPRGDNGGTRAGEAYVIFGRAGATRGEIDVTTLSATDGFVIQGDEAGDYAGWSVSSAGDVNGDGIDDVIVGASQGDNGGTNAGETYVIFGRAGATRTNIDLTTLSATDGFIIQGDAAGDASGTSVSSVGDVNGDGIDDLIVGASQGDNGGIDAGEAYVIFGRAGATRTNIDLTTLSATDGFIIQGDAAGDTAGWSVSSAGDVNDDGIDDLIVGALRSNNGGQYAGEAYVIFGRVGATRSNIDRTTLSANDGFVIQGDAAGDFAGWSVSSAGDVNGDGVDDLIVGAAYSNLSGFRAGGAYVIFGSKDIGTPDAGNSFSTATAISTGAQNSQSVGIGTDTDDYYSFVATGNGFVTASLTGLTADLDLRVYGSGLGLRALSERVGTANEDIRFEVIGGQTYYLRVDPNLTATSNYTLTTNFISVSASTISTSLFFLLNGGQLSALSKLADAAYDLGSAENIVTGFNEGIKIPGASHPDLASPQPRWLTPLDVPSLSPQTVSNINFPVKGLLPGGIYVNENAAAVVAVTSDSLFVTFRGTNDNGSGGGIFGGTPDTDDWIGKDAHYALFNDLISALDQYVSKHPELKTVYVSGHSLGASMAQHFMETHMNSLGLRYEATLFASPGYGGGSTDDPRISNIWLAGDPITVAALLSNTSGDDNIIYHNLPGLLSTQLHKVWLYADFTKFLSDYGITRVALSNIEGIDFDRFYAHDFTPNVQGGIGANNDIIDGSIYNDVILGGAGNDWLDGGEGNDVLYGGIGNDRLFGGLGSDRAYFTGVTAATVNLSLLTAQATGFGTDTLISIEHISSGGGDDKLTGNIAGNSLSAGAGNDIIDGGAGNDALYGGNGNDLLFGGVGNDRIDGGLGIDRAWFVGTTAATVNLLLTVAQVTGYGTDTLTGIEHVISGSGNDWLTGDALGNNLGSGAGNDTVNGGAGNDALYGGDGNDLMVGGIGNDRIDGGLGTDRAYYTGTTAATVNLSLITAQVTGFGTDTLLGIEHLSSDSGNDRLTGNTSGNSLISGAGNDTVDGGAGNDALYGGDGNDSLTGGTGSDTFVFNTVLGAVNSDRITDFSFLEDTIRLENAVFTGLANGVLTAAVFVANVTGLAADASDRIIYETGTGNLYFDADGTGVGARVQFAVLNSGLAVTSADFFVI